ncbi:MAG: hypothetical protein ACYS14_08090 [Planctomycetota bacterium]
MAGRKSVEYHWLRAVGGQKGIVRELLLRVRKMNTVAQYSSLVTIIVLMLGAGIVKAQTTIEGVDYVQSGPAETVTAPFIPADPGSGPPDDEPGADAVVTTGLYCGLVELTVAGTGESLGPNLNDAADGSHNPLPTPYNDSIWYQLNVSTQTLLGWYDPGFNITTTPPTQLAKHKIVYDLDADTEVSPVYVPAYRPDHTYSIVVDLGTDVPSQVHFGVSDGIFSDNSGAYTITVYQLGIAAEIDIKPETLNLQSKGLFTAFVDLPEGYDEEDIDIGTLECEGAPAVRGMMADDGRLIVKFRREDLVGVSPGDAVELVVTGLVDGKWFAGSDTIRVIDKGGKK